MSQPLRILYIVAHDPLSPNHRGGAAAIHYEQLAALADLGHEVHLWHFASPRRRARFNAFVAYDAVTWAEVQARCKSVTLTTLPYPPRVKHRLVNKALTLWTGEDVVQPELRMTGGRQLKKLLRERQPHLLWAQHYWAAQVAVLQKSAPVIYSHHDWLFRIKALRGRAFSDDRLGQAEERVARQAAVVISGSAVECRQLREVGCRSVVYLPVAYEPVVLHLNSVADDVRLVHFGGLATTATRVGLERFFEVVWPALGPDAPAPLYVIGDTTAATPVLEKHLAGVTCTGYVPDWRSALRPHDIHVIPWEHSTGQRTRLPVAFNCGQVVVAVRAGVAGFPEAEDGVNCRLVDRLEEMAPVIVELVADRAQRARLGRAARQTFEQCFTRQALRPRYETLLAAADTRT